MGLQSVAYAIQYLGAQRIGHVVRESEDPAILTLIKPAHILVFDVRAQPVAYWFWVPESSGGLRWILSSSEFGLFFLLHRRCAA